MYNRYIPQPDGSYRRNRIPEPNKPPAPQAPPPPKPPEIPEVPCITPPVQSPKGGFLGGLLPPGFDLGDLIIMLLLLLMAGDSPEDRNTAILTMALYFIM